MRTAPDLVTFGETMALLRAEHAGRLDTVDRFRLGIGGAESNVAIAAARSGLATAWFGRVGDDEFGDLIVRTLQAEGVAVGAVVRDPSPTGLMVRETTDAPDRRVLYYRRHSAGSRLQPIDVPIDLVTVGRIVHVTAITPGLSRSCLDTVRRVVEMRVDAGRPVSVDLNHRQAAWVVDDPVADVMRWLVERASVVFASREEAAMVAGGDGDALALADGLAGDGRDVVIRLGSEGAVAVVDGASHRVDALAVEAVDPVGAGDAAAAGYLVGLLRGEPPRRRLERAAYAGAMATTVPGDWEGVPRTGG